MLRSVRRLSNAALLGQPSWRTHPHMLRPGEVWPGHTKEEFRERRLRLVEDLPSPSLVVIPSYATKFGSLNIFYPFQQNNNMLYLSGFDEPDACLVVEKTDGGCASHMFLKENDPVASLWSGPRTGTARAVEELGVQQAHPIKGLSAFLQAKKSMYYDLDENSALPADCRSMLLERGKSITERLHLLRSTKREAEAAVMRKACASAAEAFKETMQWSVRQAVRQESAIAARMEFECRLRGATGLAYVPVVASGPRALILHYTRNNMVAQGGDLMFMDAGGKFDGYCTDISRAWPLSGRFSAPQRQLYEAVLRVQQACIRLCGMWREHRISLAHLNYFSVELLKEELGRLGFRNPARAVDRLYPHSIGHYLGLDLHDCPRTLGDLPLRPGTVITIEPGLYIPVDSEFPPEYQPGRGRSR